MGSNPIGARKRLVDEWQVTSNGPLFFSHRYDFKSNPASPAWVRALKQHPAESTKGCLKPQPIFLLTGQKSITYKVLGPPGLLGTMSWHALTGPKFRVAHTRFCHPPFAWRFTLMGRYALNAPEELAKFNACRVAPGGGG